MLKRKNVFVFLAHKGIQFLPPTLGIIKIPRKHGFQKNLLEYNSVGLATSFKTPIPSDFATKHALKKLKYVIFGCMVDRKWNGNCQREDGKLIQRRRLKEVSEYSSNKKGLLKIACIMNGTLKSTSQNFIKSNRPTSYSIHKWN